MVSKEKTQVLIKLGANIRKLRKLSGYTQEQLAELSDCHTNYISSVERGERNITILILLRIVNALNCKIDELFEGILHK